MRRPAFRRDELGTWEAGPAPQKATPPRPAGKDRRLAADGPRELLADREEFRGAEAPAARPWATTPVRRRRSHGRGDRGGDGGAGQAGGVTAGAADGRPAVRAPRPAWTRTALMRASAARPADP
ncbi:hypothetical protein [Streptomyces sp. NPDC001508]|uniref:hypothetical protein n=1 Tax=Streptomyces sp. NPDC001508 TaxID=3154656 RepID=UPI00332DCF75